MNSEESEKLLREMQCSKSFCNGYPECLMTHRDPKKNKLRNNAALGIVSQTRSNVIDESTDTVCVSNDDTSECNDEDTWFDAQSLLTTENIECNNASPSCTSKLDISQDAGVEPETASLCNKLTDSSPKTSSSVDSNEEKGLRKSQRMIMKTEKALQVEASQKLGKKSKKSSPTKSPPNKANRSPIKISMRECLSCTALKTKLRQSEERLATSEKHQETLRNLIESHKEKGEACNVITSNLEKKVNKLETALIEKEKIIIIKNKEIATHKELGLSFMEEVHKKDVGDVIEDGDKTKSNERDPLVILQTKLDTALSEISRLKGESKKVNETHKKETSALKDTICVLENEIVTYRKDSESLGNQIKELKSSEEIHTQASIQIQSLDKMLTESNKRCADLEKELYSAKANSPTSSADEMVDKEQQCNEIDVDYQKNSTCCQHKQKLASLRTQYEKQLNALKDVLSTNPESRGQMGIIAKLKVLVEEKDKSIGSLKEHETFMTEALIEKMSIIKKLKNDSISLKDELSTCLSKLKSVDCSNKTLEAKTNRQGEQINLLLKVNDVQKRTGNVHPLSIVPRVPSSSVPSSDQRHEYCFAEFRNAGSCNKQGCKYSHKIPIELRQDQSKIDLLINKKNICVNEFKGVNNCRKGNNCKFWHGFLPSDRSDPDLKSLVNLKLKRIYDNGVGSSRIQPLTPQNVNNEVPGFPSIPRGTYNPRFTGQAPINANGNLNQQLLRIVNP